MSWKAEQFTVDHFQLIRDVVHAQTGINLTLGKKDMVYGRLARQVRVHHNNRFDDFCTALANGDPDVQDFLINAMTTNLTAFYREAHHFDCLAASVIPELLLRNARTRRLRFWSAGCSSGEEAYSMAMTAASAIPDLQRWDLKILATDLDTTAVDRGAAGLYSHDQIEAIPMAYRKRWLLRGLGHQRGQVRVKPELQQMVSFKRLNLMHEWPMRGPFDVVFCRNVMIYFDRPTQQTLFRRFADLLSPRGYLFVGHSEATQSVSDRFVSLGKTVYQRTAS